MIEQTETYEDIRARKREIRRIKQLPAPLTRKPLAIHSAWRTLSQGWSVPEIAAAYVLCDSVTVYYVGQTASLKGRLSQHGFIVGQGGVFTKRWGFLRGCQVKFRPSRTYGDWAMIELRLIRRLKPKYNESVLLFVNRSSVRESVPLGRCYTPEEVQ